MHTDTSCIRQRWKSHLPPHTLGKASPQKKTPGVQPTSQPRLRCHAGVATGVYFGAVVLIKHDKIS